MAYMNQEIKNELAPGIKTILKKYGVKASLSVKNHSSLYVNISKGAIDLLNLVEEESKQYINGYFQVNPYFIERTHLGIAKNFFMELQAAMNKKNWDKSDIQSDYFDVGYYAYINVGSYDKPYIYDPSMKA